MRQPYKPNPIHKFYDWMDRLPMPIWVFYPSLLLGSGLILHVLAWGRGGLPRGQFNLTLLFISIWLVEILALLHFAIRASGPLLDNYRTNLAVNSEEFQRLRYEFTSIPFIAGTLFLLLGLVIGSLVAINLIPNSPEIARAFSLLFIFLWAGSLGLGLMSGYFVIRQLVLINHFFVLTKQVRFSNLEPIYAFSRYTAVIGFGTFMISFLNSFLLLPSNLQNVFSSTVAYIFVIFALAIFYLPLGGINKRLVAEKKRMLKDVNGRMEKMFARIHRAEEKETYKEATSMRNLLAALNDEKTWVESVSTWPWRRGTFTTLLSALLLPAILSLVNRVVARFLGF